MDTEDNSSVLSAITTENVESVQTNEQASSSDIGSTQNHSVEISYSLQDKGQWYKIGDCSYSLNINLQNDNTVYIRIGDLSTIENADSSLLDGNAHSFSLNSDGETVPKNITIQYHNGLLNISGTDEDKYNGTYYKLDYEGFGFLQPYSREILLYEDDYYGYSLDELKTARNEILARHGHIFSDDPDAQDYFNNKAWYAQNDQESSLNAIEKSNINVLDTLINDGGTASGLEESPSKDDLVNLNSGLQTTFYSPFSIYPVEGTFKEYPGYNTVEAVLALGGFTATKQEVEEGLTKGLITLVTDEMIGNTETFKIYEDENKNVCLESNSNTDYFVSGRIMHNGDYIFTFEEGSDDRVEKPLKQTTIYLSKHCRNGHGYGFLHLSNYNSKDGTLQTNIIDGKTLPPANCIEMNRLGYITGMYYWGD